MDFLARSKLRQQLPDGFRLAGQNQVGRNFTEWGKNEPAEMGPGMREAKPLSLTLLVSEGDEVEIKRPGFVKHRLGQTSKLPFQRLELLKQ